MKSAYKRAYFLVSEFDEEDVITTSLPISPSSVDPYLPHEPSSDDSEVDNVYVEQKNFVIKAPGDWFI